MVYLVDKRRRTQGILSSLKLLLDQQQLRSQSIWSEQARYGLANGDGLEDVMVRGTDVTVVAYDNMVPAWLAWLRLRGEKRSFSW